MRNFLVFVTLGCFFLCPELAKAAPVQQPVFVKQIRWTGTSWSGSTIVHDLGTSSRKILGTFYDLIVWDAEGNELARINRDDRIYAPAVCADIDNDGIFEIVVAGGSQVVAYEWKNNILSVKNGWPHPNTQKWM